MGEKKTSNRDEDRTGPARWDLARGKAENDLLHLLGIMRISGTLQSGEEMCLKAVRAGKAKVVFLSADASEGTKKKCKDKGEFYHVQVEQLPFGKGEIGKATGLSDRSCFAVTDRNLADKALQLLEDWRE